ncbi:MAG: methionine gamma-lyase family protein, partial [Clostridia bacterium]|nr:methionine gamma-lyase family protein [Clostridia bacterium]
MDLHLLAAAAEADCREAFARIDAVAAKNTEKVLDAFREERVALADFTATTGYGYDDVGRDKLDRIYARTFGAEAALVRLHFFNGTHTIATALYGILRPGETLLSAVDAPYDTLADVISGRDGEGSLAEWGVSYAEQAFLPDFEEYISALSKTVSELLPKA